MNMVGTAQCSQCGPDAALVKSERVKMQVGMYECIFFVHQLLPLCVALWSDNNIVVTLSNHRSPILMAENDGVFCWKKKAEV